MRTTPDERAKPYDDTSVRKPTDEFTRRLMGASQTVAAFEILGESIVPGLSTVPAILQGTFVQVTNISNTNTSSTSQDHPIYMSWNPTSELALKGSNNIILGANFINFNLDVHNIIDTFQIDRQFKAIVPVNETIIMGVQYLVNPTPGQAAAGVMKEELGNRGFIQFGALEGTTFFITVTVRQVFIKSLANPTDIISASAYSVPLSTGPIFAGQYRPDEMFGAA